MFWLHMCFVRLALQGHSKSERPGNSARRFLAGVTARSSCSWCTSAGLSSGVTRSMRSISIGIAQAAPMTGKSSVSNNGGGSSHSSSCGTMTSTSSSIWANGGATTSMWRGAFGEPGGCTTPPIPITGCIPTGILRGKSLSIHSGVSGQPYLTAGLPGAGTPLPGTGGKTHSGVDGPFHLDAGLPGAGPRDGLSMGGRWAWNTAWPPNIFASKLQEMRQHHNSQHLCRNALQPANNVNQRSLMYPTITISNPQTMIIHLMISE